MARKLRIEFAGAFQLVTSRGNQKQIVFRDETDQRLFLKTLGEACLKTGWKVHAFCLLADHFHLLLETPRANLVAGMKWLLGTYTVRHNRAHRLAGHLFRGRYRSVVVEPAREFLLLVSDYIHLNPERAGAVQPAQALADCSASSLPSYLAPPETRPPWLEVAPLLALADGVGDDTAGRLAFGAWAEARRALAPRDAFTRVRKGWCLGSRSFRDGLLQQISRRVGLHHYGDELREAAELLAERLVAEDLATRGWTESDLIRRRKGDPEKLAMGHRLRRETTMTVSWIATRLHMGTRGHLTHLFYWDGRQKPVRAGSPPAAAHGGAGAGGRRRACLPKAGEQSEQSALPQSPVSPVVRPRQRVETGVAHGRPPGRMREGTSHPRRPGGTSAVAVPHGNRPALSNIVIPSTDPDRGLPTGSRRGASAPALGVEGEPVRGAEAGAARSRSVSSATTTNRRLKRTVRGPRRSPRLRGQAASAPEPSAPPLAPPGVGFHFDTSFD